MVAGIKEYSSFVLGRPRHLLLKNNVRTSLQSDGRLTTHFCSDCAQACNLDLFHSAIRECAKIGPK